MNTNISLSSNKESKERTDIVMWNNGRLAALLMVLFLFWCASFALHAEAGHIQIKCESGVQVFLDGTLKGITSADVGGIILQDVTMGNHSLRFIKPGFTPQETNINLKAGQILVHTVQTFVPRVRIQEEGEEDESTVQAKVGTIIVKSLPVECVVDFPTAGLSGYEKSKAQIIVTDAPIGRHTGRFRGMGKTLAYTIELQSNQIIEVFVNFVKGTVEVVDLFSEGFVLVEAGSFQMGSTGESDEKPVHRVTISRDFYMSKYEVTFAQYDAFCEATGRSKPSDNGWGRGNRPAINMSWYEAIEYCNWLSRKEGLTQVYSGSGNAVRLNLSANGYRLPTEAEWEYAARGGKEGRNYTYAGGNTAGAVGWFYDNSDGKTHSVGRKQANELGLYDMSGNVWEWVWDWKGSYSSSSQTDPVGPSAGSFRVGRGGGWGSGAGGRRVANRSGDPPSNSDGALGFRPVRPIE